MIKLALLVAISVFALTPLSLAHPSTPLTPVDEASLQPDFFTFRARLLTALARHDKAALLEIVDPNIKNSFGGNDGIEEFETAWELGDPDSRIWETLTTVLALGGTFNPDGWFTAPYVFSSWPDQIDAFEHVAIVGSGVRVRSGPSLSSETIDSLSFSIVPLAGSAGITEEWIAVRLPSGHEGYVARQFVRSSLDYRAIFARTSGRWKMKILLAGD